MVYPADAKTRWACKKGAGSFFWLEGAQQASRTHTNPAHLWVGLGLYDSGQSINHLLMERIPNCASLLPSCSGPWLSGMKNNKQVLAHHVFLFMGVFPLIYCARPGMHAVIPCCSSPPWRHCAQPKSRSCSAQSWLSCTPVKCILLCTSSPLLSLLLYCCGRCPLWGSKGACADARSRWGCEFAVKCAAYTISRCGYTCSFDCNKGNDGGNWWLQQIWQARSNIVCILCGLCVYCVDTIRHNVAALGRREKHHSDSLPDPKWRMK